MGRVKGGILKGGRPGMLMLKGGKPPLPGMLMLKGGRPPLPPPGRGVLVTVGMLIAVVGFPAPGMVNGPPGGA